MVDVGLTVEELSKSVVERLRDQKENSNLDWRYKAIPLHFVNAKNIYGDMDGAIPDKYLNAEWSEQMRTFAVATERIARSSLKWEQFVISSPLKNHSHINDAPFGALEAFKEQGIWLKPPFPHTIFQTYVPPKTPESSDQRLAVDVIYFDLLSTTDQGTLINTLITSSWSPDLCLSGMVFVDGENISTPLSLESDIAHRGSKEACDRHGAQTVARLINACHTVSTHKTVTERYETPKTIKRKIGRAHV